MSRIMKKGAMGIAKDMINDVSGEENSRMWIAGMFIGLFEAGAITENELDDLTNYLNEEL